MIEVSLLVAAAQQPVAVDRYAQVGLSFEGALSLWGPSQKKSGP